MSGFEHNIRTEHNLYADIIDKKIILLINHKLFIYTIS